MLSNRTLLVCGVLSPLVYALADALGGVAWGAYSFRDQAISELGAIGAPSRAPFSALLLLAYLLALAFGVAVRRAARDRRRLHMAGTLLVAYAVLALTVGQFVPMRPRGTAQGLAGALHLGEGMVAMTLLLSAMGLAAAALRPRFRRYTIATVVVVLVFAAWGGLEAGRIEAGQSTPWLGLKERVFWYAHQSWLAVLAVVLRREGAVDQVRAPQRAKARRRLRLQIGYSFAGLALVVVLAVAGTFAFDMRRAYGRLEGGSVVVASPFGAIEFARGGVGLPVLVVHGSGGGWDQGALVARALLGTDFDWIAPSRFGYLRSALPEGATFEMQARAYAHLLDRLRIERVAVVAMSHGAPSALLFTAMYPERVLSLTLLSAGVASSTDAAQAGANVRGDALTAIFRHDVLYWAATRFARQRLLRLMGAGEEATRGRVPGSARSSTPSSTA